MQKTDKIKQYLANYKFNSLLFKNLLLLLLLIIVPIIGTITITYYSYKNMQRNELTAYSESITSKLFADWERILKDAATSLTYFGFNSNVELYMYDKNVQQYNYRIQNIQELIKLPILTKEYVDSVYIYSLQSQKIISLQGTSNYDTFPDKACLDEYLHASKPKPIAVTESPGDTFSRSQISVYQAIQYGSHLNGLAVMNLNIDDLTEEIAVPEHVTLYLTDGETVLFSNDEEIIGQNVNAIGNYGLLLHGNTAITEKYCISSKISSTQNLEVITVLDMQGYHNQLSTIRSFMTMFLFIMILVTLILSALISVRIFQPINEIVASIHESRNILMGGQDAFQEKDELEYILQSIRKTVHIKKDIDEELAERVKLLKKAQAVALQSQINPHFMNNTLETINWMAIGLLGGKNEISEMTNALSGMLRMALESTDTIIPMRMEIEHCKNYLKIQKIRYEDKFEVEWNIPKEVYESKTIRIVLQPIVENAIYHGIKHLSNKGLITISGRLQDEIVEISVTDNGLGMTADELEQLRHKMSANIIHESRHIGVTNVNQRLKLYFGEEYGVSVDSMEGTGTTVTVRFPHVQTI